MFIDKKVSNHVLRQEGRDLNLLWLGWRLIERWVDEPYRPTLVEATYSLHYRHLLLKYSRLHLGIIIIPEEENINAMVNGTRLVASALEAAEVQHLD
ncbi:hypothetical protein B7494_g3308 [Chlorociboria aeruginascens]|nr:hypothetical protein B7494_g3308 [Chlorociboria aeruginascens]